MQIENTNSQMINPQLEQILGEAQMQGANLAKNLLKMNAMEQVDQSQLGYIGTILDLYV